MTKTKEQLIIENEELRSRLTEIEETINAIRSGEVDAIMVSGTKGEQVYSLSSAETPYRTFVEEMNEGAVTLTKEGLIIFCNKRFAEFVNEPIQRVIGSYLQQFIAPDDRIKIDSLLTQQINSKNDVLIISLINSLFLKFSFYLLPSNIYNDKVILIATDISELKKKENELLELNRLLKQNFNHLRDLRIDLINANIETKGAKNKLMKINKKLVEEITKYKLLETRLKQNLKQKKRNT